MPIAPGCRKPIRWGVIALSPSYAGTFETCFWYHLLHLAAKHSLACGSMVLSILLMVICGFAHWANPQMTNIRRSSTAAKKDAPVAKSVQVNRQIAGAAHR